MNLETPKSKEAVGYIEVAVAIIERGGKFFVAQLAPKKPYAGKWEFPGGKIRENKEEKRMETPEKAMRREIMEELGVEVDIVSALPTIDHDDHRPDGKLFRLHGFICKIGQGPLKMDQEHIRHHWATPDELKELDLLESDKQLLSFL